MAKLYFRYGAVGSAKTLNLLAVAHAYEQQEKRVVVIKTEVDTRFGHDLVKSRAGLQRVADLIVGPSTRLPVDRFAGVHCVLVDEAQFMSAAMIEQLRVLADESDVPVICYGLPTDFRAQLFEGSKRLMELADDIQEVKTTCAFCNRKAVFNLKLHGGRPTLSGPTIDLGTEEKYLPACSRCYTSHHASSSTAQEPAP
jgi:thymidine kinase